MLWPEGFTTGFFPSWGNLYLWLISVSCLMNSLGPISAKWLKSNNFSYTNFANQGNSYVLWISQPIIKVFHKNKNPKWQNFSYFFGKSRIIIWIYLNKIEWDKSYFGSEKMEEFHYFMYFFHPNLNFGFFIVSPITDSVYFLWITNIWSY